MPGPGSKVIRAGLKDIDKKVFLRLLKYIAKNYKLSLVIVFVCIVVSALSSSAATYFLKKLIDSCITPGLTKGLAAVWPEIVRTLSIMALIYFLGITCAFFHTRLMANVCQGSLKKLRDDMFSNMQSLPISFFDKNERGAIMSSYTNDVDAIRQLIGQGIPMLFQSLLSITSMFAIMLFFSLPLTILVCLFIILMTQLTKKFGGGSAKFMKEQQKFLAKTEGFVEEIITGQKVVQVFCHEEEAKKSFDKINQELFSSGEKANRYGNILGPILNNLGNIMYVVIAIIGSIIVALNLGAMTAGIIISFLGMARQLSQTVGQISNQVSIIAMGAAGASRVFKIIDEKGEEDEGYVHLVNAKVNENGQIEESLVKSNIWAWKHPHSALGNVTYQKLEGDIELINVDFGYTKEKTVLHNISIHARPGEKIAFVGSTGAGKTTITNLLNRFYDIQDGKIRYDGININKICKADLRKSLGMVLQDVNLFTGTVMENIRYGRLDASDEECIKAAKLANAHSFISKLPQGYQTMLTGNASSLSQGQRQLLSIARAAVADPPAMILDEATSSIDTRTESLVQKGMDNLMKGRTIFVIAHRLSTVKNSDRIIVLDHGKIIEEGSHMELLKQKGVYYKLYTGAFELD